MEHCHHYAGFTAHSSPFLFFRFQCFCFLKETPGTKHKIYSLCVFLVIGSKVTQVFEFVPADSKTGCLNSAHCAHMLLPQHRHAGMYCRVIVSPDSNYGLWSLFSRLFSQGHKNILCLLTCLVFRLQALCMRVSQKCGCRCFTKCTVLTSDCIIRIWQVHHYNNKVRKIAMIILGQVKTIRNVLKRAHKIHAMCTILNPAVLLTCLPIFCCFILRFSSPGA